MNNSLGTQAKIKLNELALSVDMRLEKYWNEEINKEFGFEKKQKYLINKVLRHAKEHNLRQAKRLRAAFVYYGYRLGKELNKRRSQEIEKIDEGVWRVMEGVELVQTALLMHDDFMDEDLLRRGLPTTQIYFGGKDKHYGDSMAVNVGDVVLCLGYERILACELEAKRVLEVGKILMRGITNTAFGQIYDVTLPKLGELTEEKVMAVHRAKTAIYTFQNPLMIGGVLAGLPNKALDILREYSDIGGVAFQLQDDLLGMFGEVNKTGKSVNSDLLQGKCTLLIAKTIELGSEEQKRNLLKAWGNKKATEQEINKAKEAIKDSGSYEYSLKKIKTMANKAIIVINRLNAMELNSEAINFLKGIMKYIVKREV